MSIRVYGADYSTFVRTTRMALEKASQAYELVPVDVFKKETQSKEHLARSPFGKIPVLEHDGFEVTETMACLDYIDRVFDAGLFPADPKLRARAIQIAESAANYGYKPLVWEVFVPAVAAPKQGGKVDQAKVDAGLRSSAEFMAALETLVDGSAYLAGDKVSVADLVVAPLFDFLGAYDQGHSIITKSPRLGAWWDRFREDAAFVKTRPAVMG